MLKKSIIILVILAVINNINFAASSKHLDISPEKELLILNNILNRNREITTVQKEQFTEKLYNFLRDYEGSNEIFNLWKTISSSGVAISDPLLQYQKKYNPAINDIVIGHRPIETILKHTLNTIKTEADIFIIEPYLDILTKTNVNIDLVRCAENAFSPNWIKQNYDFLALIYFFTNQIPQIFCNMSTNNEHKDTLLTLAIRYNNINLVKKLLKNPLVDVNAITTKYVAKRGYDNIDWYGTNPLSLAMDKNLIDIVVELLNHNATLIIGENSLDDYQVIPRPQIDHSKILLWATQKPERIQILQILAQKKDFYKCKDKYSISTALFNVYKLNNLEAMKLLIDVYGDNISIETLAAIFSNSISDVNNEFNKNVIKLFFEKFKVEKIYPNALIDAVKKQNKSVVEILIENDFDRKIKDNHGNTALDYAKSYKYLTLIDMLETITI